jgi:hypothetical protein
MTGNFIDFFLWEPHHRFENVLRRNTDGEADRPKQSLIDNIGWICVASLVVNDVAYKAANVHCSENFHEIGKDLQQITISMQGTSEADWKKEGADKSRQRLPDMLSRPCEATASENLITFHSKAGLFW